MSFCRKITENLFVANAKNSLHLSVLLAEHIFATSSVTESRLPRRTVHDKNAVIVGK